MNKILFLILLATFSFQSLAKNLTVTEMMTLMNYISQNETEYANHFLKNTVVTKEVSGLKIVSVEYTISAVSYTHLTLPTNREV